MVRVMSLVLALGLIVGVAGCASVESGKKLNDMGLTLPESSAVAHLNGKSWGIYFLPIFPLLAGDTASGSGMAMLTDSCRVEPVVDMVTRSAKKMGAVKVTDLQSDRTSVMVVPFLIWYKSVEVSGNAIK